MQISSSFESARAQQRLAIDSRSLDDLRAEAVKDPKAAIKKVAGEFEAMFLNIVMQTMRETSFSGEEESNALNTFRGMQDQQTVQQMSLSGGMGLGDMIARQIAKQSGIEWDEPVKKTAAASSMQLLALQNQRLLKPCNSWNKTVFKAQQRNLLQAERITRKIPIAVILFSPC